MKAKRFRFASKLLYMSILCSFIAAFGMSNLMVHPVHAATNYLHTSGNKILDASNNIADLSGVN